MTTSPIAATAGTARQRLASSLASLQQDPNLPAPILDVVSGLARAMGPLFQVERGTGDPSLLFTARAVLQETLGRMQTVDQAYPGVSDATAAIAQSLGMIFATIRDHRIEEAVSLPSPSLVSVAPSAPPSTPPIAPVAPASQPAPVATPPVAAPPVAYAAPQPAPVPLVQPAAAPVPLVHPAAAPVPLVQPAAAPVLLVPAVPAASPAMARETSGGPARDPVTPSLLPDTAAKVPVGPNGVPRLEAELDVHSDSNFYTNFLGDIRDHGGIFVATFGALTVNTACEVLISFPGALTAEVRGVVKWRRSNTDNGQIPGLGVEITHGTPDAWKLIDRFIKNREPIIHEV
ncbi:MAG: hypothetical protein U0324_45220 [Polyangiales bacterium]